MARRRRWQGAGRVARERVGAETTGWSGNEEAWSRGDRASMNDDRASARRWLGGGRSGARGPGRGRPPSGTSQKSDRAGGSRSNWRPFAWCS